jgi:hypothetical protein
MQKNITRRLLGKIRKARKCIHFIQRSKEDAKGYTINEDNTVVKHIHIKKMDKLEIKTSGNSCFPM